MKRRTGSNISLKTRDCFILRAIKETYFVRYTEIYRGYSENMFGYYKNYLDDKRMLDQNKHIIDQVTKDCKQVGKESKRILRVAVTEAKNRIYTLNAAIKKYEESWIKVHSHELSIKILDIIQREFNRRSQGSIRNGIIWRHSNGATPFVRTGIFMGRIRNRTPVLDANIPNLFRIMY